MADDLALLAPAPEPGFAPDPFAAAPAPPPWPTRPKKSFSVAEEAVVTSVCDWVRDLTEDEARSGHLDARLNRYAKYRGWLTPKSYPWPHSSNIAFPMLQTAELRLNSGLHNALMTMRPLVSAKATNPAHEAKEENATNLIDTQFFLDPGQQRAEAVVSDYVSAFCQDGNTVLFTPWVHEENDETRLLFRPPVPDGQAPDDYLWGLLDEFFGQPVNPVQDPAMSHRYTVTYRDREQKTREATCTVFTDDEGALELEIRRPVTQYDGPVALPIELDDLFVPTRCDNLQPPSSWNPRGAPRVVVRTYLSVDAVRRNRDSGRFNWLDATGLEKIEVAAEGYRGLRAPRPGDAEERKDQKDAMEGREHQQPTADAALGQVVLPFYMVFDQWPIRGEQLEHVYWVIQPDAKVLCEGRPLNELWPATRPYRPLPEAKCIPVSGRWYAIGMLELGEHLQDVTKATFDMAFDAASLAKRPWGFYATNAKMPLDAITLAPGDLYPVQGDPRQAVYYPTLPGGDQQWAFQVIGLTVQAFERLMMTGDLQLGRVPTGKASALRTYGTTQALLQQGDVRADTMLLRLFGGLMQMAECFHAMNRHFLPPGKEIRVLGFDGPEARAYRTLKGIEDIDADVMFEFRPDFQLSNMDALAGVLEGAIGLLATPLAFQSGVTTPVKFYAALKDYFRAQKLDWRKYLQVPDPEGGMPMLADEVWDAIMHDQMPDALPLEGLQAHWTRLQEHIQTDETMALLTPPQVSLLRAYMGRLAQRAQREQMAKAAQVFQQSQGQRPGQGGQGVGTVVAPPEMGTGAEATGQMGTEGAPS